jgi:hypothetical protein
MEGIGDSSCKSFGQGQQKLGNVLVYPNIGDEVIKSLEERRAKVALQKVVWGRPVCVRVESADGIDPGSG